MTEIWTRSLRQRMLGAQIGSAAGQAAVTRTATPGSSSTDRMIQHTLERHDSGDHSSASRDSAAAGDIKGAATGAVADGGSGGSTKKTGGAGTSHMIPV